MHFAKRNANIKNFKPFGEVINSATKLTCKQLSNLPLCIEQCKENIDDIGNKQTSLENLFKESKVHFQM